jgi:hypothetical protein
VQLTAVPSFSRIAGRALAERVEDEMRLLAWNGSRGQVSGCNVGAADQLLFQDGCCNARAVNLPATGGFTSQEFIPCCLGDNKFDPHITAPWASRSLALAC